MFSGQSKRAPRVISSSDGGDQLACDQGCGWKVKVCDSVSDPMRGEAFSLTPGLMIKQDIGCESNQ